MTIISLGISILKNVSQVISLLKDILDGQYKLSSKIDQLQVSVESLAETQAKQSVVLDKIAAAVEGSPIAVSARIVVGTPVPQ